MLVNTDDVEHRVVGVALPGDEAGEQRGGEGEGGDRRRRRPAVHRALDDGPHQRARWRRSTGPCRAGRSGRSSCPWSWARPAPIGTRATMTTGTLIISTEPHQKCSSSQPPVTGPRATARPAVAAHTAMATARSLATVKTLTRIARVAGNISAAPTPIAARQRDQGVGRAGRGAEGGERGEQAEADHQHPLAPDAVAEAAGGHQQAGEDEDVGVDDPLQLAGRGAELGGQRRQGDVDDRAVEHDDQDRRAEHGEDQPPSPVGGGG